MNNLNQNNMEAKLIKTGNEYLLKDLKGEVLAITSGLKEGRMLSLENCQEIENGYDLYELAKASMNKINILFNNSLDSKSHTIGFKAGWHHAIKILGDKKFSEDDMVRYAKYIVATRDLRQNGCCETDERILKSLQQTEWDVIILEEPIDLAFYENGNRFPIDVNLPDRFKYKPLLDADGCLILKRKI